MKILIGILCCLATALAQYDGPAPPRLNIPGAIPLPALKLQQQGRAFPINAAVRVRKPNRPQQPPQQIFHSEPRYVDDAKPVIEEPEDEQYSPPSQPSPPRALFTHEPQEDTHSNAARFNIERPKPVQQQQQHINRPAAPAPQPQRPRAHNFDQDQRPHQKSHSSEDKPKKPVAQILRKWREENEDGSITWGYENDDGSFKEETIGIDCITRGVYGYVDPDGEKREYKYETGILCDPDKRDQEEEDLEDDEVLANLKAQQQAKRPQNQQQQYYRN